MKKFLILSLFLSCCGSEPKDDCEKYLDLASEAKEIVCIEYGCTFCGSTDSDCPINDRLNIDWCLEDEERCLYSLINYYETFCMVRK